MSINQYQLTKLREIYKYEECISYEDNNEDLFPHGALNIVKNHKKNIQQEQRYYKTMQLLSFFENSFDKINNPHLNNEQRINIEHDISLLQQNMLILMESVNGRHNPYFSITKLKESCNQWKKFAIQYSVSIEEESRILSKEFKNYMNYIDTNDISNNLHDELKQLYKTLPYVKSELMTPLDEIDHDIKEYINSFYTLLNNPDGFYETYKNVAYDDFTKALDIIKNEESLNIIKKVEDTFTVIYEKIKKEKSYEFTFSDEYKKLLLKDSSIIQTLEKKNIIENKVSVQIDLSDNTSKIHEFILFNDNSVIILYKDGSIKQPRKNEDIFTDIEDIIKSEIGFILRKKPVLLKHSIESLKTDYSKFENLFLVLNTYIKNENILKSLDYDLISKFKTTNHYEIIDDEMNHLILEHKIKQYAHSISSNKYKHLYNDESYDIIRELYYAEVDNTLLQGLIGKKLAAYKTPEDFNNGLNKMVEALNEFEIETVLAKANSNQSAVVYNADNVLILEINNFKQSKSLGSPSWCISREEYYFNSYKDETNHQYFIYDFNKDSKNNESMIGITLFPDGIISAAHLKNDDAIQETQTLFNIVNKIKNSQPEYYGNKQSSITMRKLNY